MDLMQVCFVLISLTITSCLANPVGYSYAKFSGPVSGPEKEVFVHDEHSGQGHVDYIAQPDYHFAYGVEDPKTKVLQNRKESRHGDTVKGEYSVVEPDGTLRLVRYTADKLNGFQAEVITDGKSSSYGYDSPAPVHRDYHVSGPSGPAAVEPVEHETYGTHEDIREEDEDDEEDDEDEDSY